MWNYLVLDKELGSNYLLILWRSTYKSSRLVGWVGAVTKESPSQACLIYSVRPRNVPLRTMLLHSV